jgi:hypothetical protein
VPQADCIDQKYEIIVGILTKLTEKHQNIHTMGRFSEKTRMKYFENHIFSMWEGSLENLYQQIESYQLFGKDPYKSTVCRPLFRKIGIASDRIDEMKRSKN